MELGPDERDVCAYLTLLISAKHLDIYHYFFSNAILLFQPFYDEFYRCNYFCNYRWGGVWSGYFSKAVFTRQAFELSRAAMQLRLSVTWKRVQRSKPDTGYVTSLWRHKVTSRMTLIYSPWLPRSQLCCDVSAANAHWPLAQWHTSLSGHRVKGWPVA